MDLASSVNRFSQPVTRTMCAECKSSCDFVYMHALTSLPRHKFCVTGGILNSVKEIHFRVLCSEKFVANKELTFKLDTNH